MRAVAIRKHKLQSLHYITSLGRVIQSVSLTSKTKKAKTSGACIGLKVCPATSTVHAELAISSIPYVWRIRPPGVTVLEADTVLAERSLSRVLTGIQPLDSERHTLRCAERLLLVDGGEPRDA